MGGTIRTSAAHCQIAHGIIIIGWTPTPLYPHDLTPIAHLTYGTAEVYVGDLATFTMCLLRGSIAGGGGTHYHAWP